MQNSFHLILFLIIPFLAVSQASYTISGFIKDKKDGETLIGATLLENDNLKGCTSNEYGFYSLSLPEGNYSFTYSYLGYKDTILEIKLLENTEIDIELTEQTTTLEQVTVTANNSIDPNQTNEFNVVKLPVKEILKMPSMFGEADVIKAIQTLSGVKTVGDGSSGMFVRGGSSDQNLILIDEAPIYNPSHLFGLVSVFNPDALNHVSFYKSNIPAQYGGRVSSVIDCKMKEGNMKAISFSAGISPFSSILSLDGPLIKDKSAFLISARKSFVDIFATPNESTPLVPGFYDVNFKINTKLGKKDRLYFSIYNGNDRLESADGLDNKWGNIAGTLRWNRAIGSKLFSNVSFIFSNYTNNLEFTDNEKSYKWETGLKDFNSKIDLSYYHNSTNTIRFGIGSIYHQFIPGETADISQSIPRINAFEHNAYLLNDLKVNNWLGLNYGIRFSAFQNTGKAEWYEYDQEYFPINLHRNEKGIYNSYFYLEPRISANFTLHPLYSLKFAYARNTQYMQVLQNNALSYTSLETWFPANPNIKPIIADIISAGWFYSIKKQYNLSVESYYKTYQNQIDYIDHATLLNNPFIEGQTRTGTAKAFGLEILLKKNIGKITGSISYTYSRAIRQIKGINNDKRYNSLYDIPHDFRINANYQLTPKWSFGALWIYSSGRPVTLPTGFYYENDEPIPIYSERNSSRFPKYSRLDLSTTYTIKNSTKRSYWTLNAGAFNILGRKNPLSYEFARRSSSEGIDVYQYTLFTILPSFSIKYNY